MSRRPPPSAPAPGGRVVSLAPPQRWGSTRGRETGRRSTSTGRRARGRSGGRSSPRPLGGRRAWCALPWRMVVRVRAVPGAPGCKRGHGCGGGHGRSAPWGARCHLAGGAASSHNTPRAVCCLPIQGGIISRRSPTVSELFVPPSDCTSLPVALHAPLSGSAAQRRRGSLPE